MIKYTGNGNYYQGIPARDLSEDEWKAIGKRKQKTLVDLGLYATPRRKVKSKLEVTEDVIT